MAETEVEQDIGGKKRKKAPKTKHMRWNTEEVTALIGLYAKYHEIPNCWATINEELNRQWPTRQRTVKQMKDKWKTLQELIPQCGAVAQQQEKIKKKPL